MVPAVSGTGTGGIRKERPGRRKSSTACATSPSGASAIRRDLGHGTRTASAARIVHDVAERAKHAFDEQLLASGARLGKRLFGMPRERVAQPAHAFVVVEIDGAAWLGRFGPLVPRAHQRVLQQRELVLIGAHVVQQPLHEARRDTRARYRHRAGDRRAQLVARHARHQVLAVVERLRQAGEFHAVADEVRPHGHHDVDGHDGLFARFEQKLHEPDGVAVPSEPRVF
jgi:hypothetical protein